MTAARRRTAGARRRRRALLNGLATAMILLVGGVSLWAGLASFLEGRYVGGKGGGRQLREAWDAYGPDAFAGESPIHLLLAGVGLALLVGCGAHLLATIGARRIDLMVIGRIVGVIFGVAATAALAVLIRNWAAGIPLHNFLPTGADDLLYALWCTVPLLVLAGVVYIGIASGLVQRIRRRARRAEAGAANSA